jgi:co-chaperonin GroES (HSP10)
MKAILDKVIVKPISTENVSKEGFYLGETKDAVYNKGEVLDVGEKVDKVKVGDIAYYNKNRGAEINVNGEKVIVIANLDIWLLD